MKTSWIKIKENEDYLFGYLPPAKHLVFSAELLVDAEREADVRFQKQTYELVRAYARKKLKDEVEAVHQKLFGEKKHRRFKENILAIFKVGGSGTPDNKQM